MDKNLPIIEFHVPDADAPGFLSRLIRALSFRQSSAAGDVTPELMEQMADFIADFVTNYPNHDAARGAVLRASQKQIDELMGAITGKRSDPPLENTARSTIGSVDAPQ